MIILQKNKGFTLVELVLSIAILSLIIIAISGMMYSNNIVFRKTKSDVNLQNVAQDCYDKLSSDIMQAKNIAIEGYVVNNAGDVIEFKSTGKDNQSTVAISSKAFLRQSDINIQNDKNSSVSYSDFLNTVKGYSISQLDDVNKNNNSHNVQSYYYNIRYMDTDEKNAYASFFNKVDSYSGFSSLTNINSFESLKSDNPSGNPKYNIKEIYVKRIIISLNSKIDSEFCSSTPTKNYEPGIIVYEFDKNEMKVTYQYTQMDKLNTTQVYTDKLNYVIDGSNNVSAVIAKVDSNDGSVGIKMNFAKETMTYDVEGVVGIRNTYVLNDAN